jgi:hypothetical protein
MYLRNVDKIAHIRMVLKIRQIQHKQYGSLFSIQPITITLIIERQNQAPETRFTN